MKVVYVGNFGAPHSTESEVAKALEVLGVEVVAQQEDETPWRELATIDAGADFVLWTHTHGLAPESTHCDQWEGLTRCARAGVRVVGYHLDRWHGLQREHQVRTEPFFAVDLLCTADGGHDDEWRAAGVNHRWFPPAVSEFECVPGVERDEYRSDIAFVGSWQGGYHEESTHRHELVEFLRQRYGRRVAFWPRPGEHAVRGEALRDLYASTGVVVGDSCLVGETRAYVSDRVPETLGRGGFLLHPHIDGVFPELWKSGEHLVTWPPGDWAALAHLIDHYVEAPDERRAIAETGRAHTLAHHTYSHRMRELLDVVAGMGQDRQAA